LSSRGARFRASVTRANATVRRWCGEWSDARADDRPIRSMKSVRGRRDSNEDD
jgi:hypothetical protein